MSDGILKLTEYLNQTRRQAEISIECLNQRVNELENENASLKSSANKFLEEKQYYIQMSDQLKLENSKKWRLQERDDWKALVDSVQRDRDRLHDENLRLQTELAQATAFIEQQETLLAQAPSLIEECTSCKAEDSSPQKPIMQAMCIPTDGCGTNNSLHINGVSNGHAAQPVIGDVTSDPSSPSRIPYSSASPNGSPRIIIPDSTAPSRAHSLRTGPLSPQSELRFLRGEIFKLTSQLDVERRAAETERMSMEVEITRLRHDLLHCTCRTATRPSSPTPSTAETADGANKIVDVHQHSTMIVRPPFVVRHHRHRTIWENLNVFDLIFGVPETPPSLNSTGRVVTKV